MRFRLVFVVFIGMCWYCVFFFCFDVSLWVVWFCGMFVLVFCSIGW